MNGDELVPLVVPVCAIPDGKGRQHRKRLGRIALVDGELRGTLVAGTVNGVLMIHVRCPKHGLLQEREAVVRSGFDGWEVWDLKGAPLEVAFGHRSPVFRAVRH